MHRRCDERGNGFVGQRAQVVQGLDQEMAVDRARRCGMVVDGSPTRFPRCSKAFACQGSVARADARCLAFAGAAAHLLEVKSMANTTVGEVCRRAGRTAALPAAPRIGST